MKKNFIWALFALLLCLSVLHPLPICSADPEGQDKEPAYLTDTADILTDSEEKELSDLLRGISTRQRLTVAVVTVKDCGGKTQRAFADDYFDDGGYGYGADRDGVLLLVDMGERQCWISTHGYGITAFTDAGIAYIGDAVKDDMADGNYAGAFRRYAELCDDFVTQAREGKPYDTETMPRRPLPVLAIPISLAIGFVIALITVGGMKGQLKSVRSQPLADCYVRKDSMEVTRSSDLFLYSTLSRTQRPKENDSNSSSGGSSTHTSSSGSTHGGGGFGF